MRLMMLCAALGLAVSAEAQVLSRPPANLRDVAVPVMERVNREHPDAWACAHSGRACEHDWINLAASALHAIDPRFGLNGKRGNANDVSMDVITYLLDPSNPRKVAAWDVCGSCGASGARVVWNEITNYATIGQPGTAVWIRPEPVSGGGVAPTPTPTPTPTPSVDLRPVLDALEALSAKVDALAAKPAPSVDLAPVTDRLDALSLQVDLARQDVQALASKPLTVEWPEYQGSIFGKGVTLRPRQ